MDWPQHFSACISAFLKHCGKFLAESGAKGSQHPKKTFVMSFKKPVELFLNTEEITRKPV